MPEKEISLLRDQIDKLGEKNFDLDAWKNYTMILIERIFGEGNTRVKMVRDLHYDYSSWNLRDATGIGKAFDPVKIQAREILQAIIAELEVLGTPEGKTEKPMALKLVAEELTGKQMRELEAILQSDQESKEEKINKIISTIEKENLVSLIVRILLA